MACSRDAKVVTCDSGKQSGFSLSALHALIHDIRDIHDILILHFHVDSCCKRCMLHHAPSWAQQDANFDYWTILNMTAG